MIRRSANAGSRFARQFDFDAMGKQLLLLVPSDTIRTEVEEALSAAGVAVHHCRDIEELCCGLGQGGAAMISVQALDAGAVKRLAEAISAQPSWSDVPILVLATGEEGSDGSGFGARGAMEAIPGAVLVPWPSAPAALASAVQAALRARRTQYRLRDSMAECGVLEKELHASKNEFDMALDQRVAERTAAVEQRAAQLRAMAFELTQSEQRDRRRLARLLHDNLQQLLVAARMKLGALRRRVQGSDLERAMEQVDGLLDQSIAESRSLSIELSPPILYDAGLIPAIHWLARHMQERHGLVVEVEVQPEAEPEAEDVRVFLFQAVRELLLNVVEHAHTSWARVELSRHDKRARIDVVDQGAGFDLARQEAEFTSAGHFGLFALRERLQLLGGRVDVVTSPGAGTRVTILAPPEVVTSEVDRLKALAPGSAGALPQVEVAASTAGNEKIRVLLADDHEILREGLATLLEEEPDIEVIGGAADGQMAVEMALRTKPNVVVMDVTMPLMNGVEATRRITRALPDVRVIGLSMHDEQDMAAAMLEAGATDYLPKGDSSEALIDAIRHWFATPPSRPS